MVDLPGKFGLQEYLEKNVSVRMVCPLTQETEESHWGIINIVHPVIVLGSWICKCVPTCAMVVLTKLLWCCSASESYYHSFVLIVCLCANCNLTSTT